jgi:parvulin-like peptidyl-prolyl isomerase
MKKDNIFCAITFVCLTITSGVAQLADSTMIAKAGKLDISYGDIKSEMVNLSKEQIAAAKKDPALLNEAIRSLVIQKIMVREAIEKKWHEQAEVMSQIERQRNNIIAETYLKSIALSKNYEPSAVELQKAYEDAASQLMTKRKLQLAQIYISAATDEKAKAAKLAEIANIEKKINTPGSDFSVIAREHSEEISTAKKSGEIGWLTEDMIQPRVKEKLKGAKKGFVSPLITQEDGWHIIKVLDVEEPKKLTLEEVMPLLRDRLKEMNAQLVSKEYLADLLQKNPITINEIELLKVLDSKEK